MKNWRIMCLIVAMLSLGQVVNAQPWPHNQIGKNEFSLSFGAFPISPNRHMDSANDDLYSPFEISLEYLHHVGKHLSLGLNVNYCPYYNDDYHYESHRTNNYFRHSEDYQGCLVNIMPTARLDWLRFRHFSLYTRLSAGLGLEMDEKTDKTYMGFVYQFVPVGITVGNTIYARLEFPGFGYQGLFSAGLGYRF